jgi:hypothetical protein
MAIDTAIKRANMIGEMMVAVDKLMEAIGAAAALQTEIDSNAADLVFVDADFDVDGLRHLDAAAFTAILEELDFTDPSKLVGWIYANGKHAILNKIRP